MSQQPGRNDPCPCGSGKKYKKCCEGKSEQQPSLPQTELGQLVALFQAGRYLELETLARVLLERKPSWGVGWKLLGTAQGIQGKDAVPALQKAVQLLPSDAEVHNNLGNALKELRQFDDAAASYRRALVIDPRDAATYNNLGIVLKKLGHLDQAMASYQQALRLKPDFAEAHNNLGNALQEMGFFDDALASCRRALALKPNYARAHNSLGIVLHDLRQFDAALTSYKQAIEIKPDYANAYSNLGATLQDLGQYDAALASLNRAIELNPNYAEAHNNLGSVLQERGQFDGAVRAYRRAIEIRPDFAEAHNNLGSVLQNLGDDSAVESFYQALEVKPNYIKAQDNLLFALNFTTNLAGTACLEEAKAYGRMVAKQVEARFSTWRCESHPKRLRVGLISGDLCNHPVGYALENLLTHLDTTTIELIAYSSNPKADEFTQRIQPRFASWQPIYGQNDADATRLIHDDGIHILLDLSGHTAHNRLPVFAWKPAPIQASWLGYFATTGVAEMDYLLTSEVAVPEAHRAHFTESIWYLPDIWLCFTPPEQTLAVTPLPAWQSGRLTFGCFQRLDKISDTALSTWGRILKAIPDARLRLANKQLGDAVVAAQFMQRLQQHGIAPTRVQLQGPAATRLDYLARYAEVDVMLDTFPYPGVTTTCEALWMGVPTLSLAGETLLSRQGAGMLVPAGLEDWIATSETEYVEKAVQLTRDLAKLAALRVGLRQQVSASPVFDAPRFARNFEAAMWGMWQAWRDKQ